MKKFLFMAMAAIMMVLVPTQMNAQNKKQPSKNGSNKTQCDRQMDPEKMAEGRVKQMAESLNLSGDQQTKLLKLFKDNAPKCDKNNKGEKPCKEQCEKDKKNCQNGMNKLDAEIKKILTEEQYAQYQKEEQKRMKSMPERGNRPEKNGEGKQKNKSNK